MKQTQRLAFAAMIIAIIALMCAVPFLGIIQIGVISITILHIPTLVGALTFKDRNLAIISGLAFGIGVWLVALFRPVAPTDIIFQNPLVSVLPRVLFALIAYYLYKFLSTKLKQQSVSLVITSIVATFCHTVMVLGLMLFFALQFYPDAAKVLPASFWPLLWATLSANGIIEIIVAAIAVPAIVTVLNKTLKIK